MLDSIVFVAYLLLLIIAAWWKGKAGDSNASFLLGDKATGLAALTATLVMAELNMSTLLGFSSMGYIAGTKALLLPFAFSSGSCFTLWQQPDPGSGSMHSPYQNYSIRNTAPFSEPRLRYFFF